MATKCYTSPLIETVRNILKMKKYDDDADETKVWSYYGMTWLWYFDTVRYTQSKLITMLNSTEEWNTTLNVPKFCRDIK